MRLNRSEYRSSSWPMPPANREGPPTMPLPLLMPLEPPPRSERASSRRISRGARTVSEDAFLESLRESVRAGAAGIAVGRQVFQAPDPAAAAHRIAEVVFGSNRPIPLEAAR